MARLTPSSASQVQVYLNQAMVTRLFHTLGVPVTVTGVAQVKIMSESQEYLSTACEQFLGKSEKEIEELLLETFEGPGHAN